jgi:hypothetical protein
MTIALLHRFNVLEGIANSYPQALTAASLDELAALVWDVDVSQGPVYRAKFEAAMAKVPDVEPEEYDQLSS